MLNDKLEQRVERTIGKRYLTLAIDDILLQLERYGLGVTDILHSLWYRDTRLLADAEEAIDSRTRREDHRRMLQNLGTLGAKLLKRDTHNTYQRLIIDAEFVFL